nr:uncharacterized protein LOC117680343 isoform X2 [Crassostrea gigas]
MVGALPACGSVKGCQVDSKEANKLSFERKVSFLRAQDTHKDKEEYCVEDRSRESNMGEYAVVEFTDTNEVELVPVSWITSDKKECFWPNFRSTSKQKMAVRQGMLPNSTEFKKFVVKIMYQTKDYEKARKKLKEAECKSDLQTEVEEEEVTKKRTKRPNPKYDDSDTESSDSDSEIRPRSPKKKKENFANTANTASTAPTAHPTITSQGLWT